MDPSYLPDFTTSALSLCPGHGSLPAFLQTCQIQHLCIYFSLFLELLYDVHRSHFLSSFRFLFKCHLSNEFFFLSFASKRWDIPCVLPGHNCLCSMITAHTYGFTYLLIICLPQGIFDFFIANSPMPGPITVYQMNDLYYLTYIFLLLITNKRF